MVYWGLLGRWVILMLAELARLLTSDSGLPCPFPSASHQNATPPLLTGRFLVAACETGADPKEQPTNTAYLGLLVPKYVPFLQ